MWMAGTCDSGLQPLPSSFGDLRPGSSHAVHVVVWDAPCAFGVAVTAAVQPAEQARTRQRDSRITP
jgi:hypothetical protein